MKQNEVLEDFVKMSKMLEEKEQRIEELEEENENRRQLGLALYTALYEHLGNHGVIDNVPSAIDQLVGKDCGEYASIYNEYKSLKKKIKELEEQIEKLKKGEIIPVSVAEQSFKMRDKQLILYKKALELARETIKQYIKIVFNDKNYEVSEKYFIDRAKEILKNDREESRSKRK